MAGKAKDTATAEESHLRPFARLSDPDLAVLMEAPLEDVDKLREMDCPQNDDGTWDYLTVLAFVEQQHRVHYHGRP